MLPRNAPPPLRASSIRVGTSVRSCRDRSQTRRVFPEYPQNRRFLEKIGRSRNVFTLRCDGTACAWSLAPCQCRSATLPALRTCASQPPIVLREIRTPWRSNIFSCRCSGWWSASLLTITCASMLARAELARTRVYSPVTQLPGAVQGPRATDCTTLAVASCRAAQSTPRFLPSVPKFTYGLDVASS